MPITIEMPKLSDTMTEGTLLRWVKEVGETVEVGDVLAEVETDKATMEMEAFDQGTLSEVYVNEGQRVVLQVCRNGRINRPIWYAALRYVTCSSGVNLNRKSFCWLWDGTCAFRSPTGMWKCSWPSAAFLPIMSPYGDGYSLTVQKWSGVCARGSNPPTIVGGWMKPMCVLRQMGLLVPGSRFQRGHDRLPALRHTRCRRRGAFFE